MTTASSSTPSPDPPPAVFRHGARILFQGDSITDCSRDRTGKYPARMMGHGYPSLIAGHCGGHFPELQLTFLNRGCSGDHVADLAKRWQRDTLDLKPDVLSILIGVNDVWHNLDSGREIPFAAIEVTYDRILTDFSAALPAAKIVLCEPFILPGSATRQRWRDWQVAVQRVRQIVAVIGDKHGLPVVRFQRVLDDACQRASADYWLFDGVHPVYAGHQLLADEWLRAVKEAWPE